MNRNRKQDDDVDDKDDDGFAAVSDKTSTSLKTSTSVKSAPSVNMPTTSLKQRQKGSSTDRTFNELIAGDGDEKSSKNVVVNVNRTTTVKDRKESVVYLHPPPAFSKKTYAIGFILIACVAIAISINFINLHSDFQDLKDFHRGFMGRKLLIHEGRLTSRTYMVQLKEFKSIKDVSIYR